MWVHVPGLEDAPLDVEDFAANMTWRGTKRDGRFWARFVDKRSWMFTFGGKCEDTSTASASAPESEESTSDCTLHVPTFAQSATLSGTLSPAQSSEVKCSEGRSPRVPSGQTSPRSTLVRGAEQWISSLRDSHVSLGPRPENEIRRTTHGGSGRPSPASFATVKLDRPSSWRTYRAWQMEASTTYSGTWPKRGSMLNGGCIELSMSGLPIDDLGSSSSPTDPTSLMDFFGQPSDEESDEEKVLGEESYPNVWPTAVTTDSQASARHTTTTSIMRPGTMLTDAMRIFLAEIQVNLDPDSRQLHALRDSGKNTSMQAVLSPPFVEALMGYPSGWTDCTASGTRSFPRSSLERGVTSSRRLDPPGKRDEDDV